MPSLKGHLLIASAPLMDPNFVQSVVLLIQHDEDGAMGVVLNRPLDLTVQEACEQSGVGAIACAVSSPLHQGGPCEGPLMAIHTNADAAESEIVPGVYFTVGREKMEQLLQDDGLSIRFIANYSGWGPGQLEAELTEGSWVTLPATKEHIFSDTSRTWPHAMSAATIGRWIDPRFIPEDPELN